MKVHTRVYVVQCKTPGYFYVGSTTRLPYMREAEHRNGWGAHWTTRHGFKRMLFMLLVPQRACKQLEDALTVGVGSLDTSDFHCLEGLQAMVERRRGGEGGGRGTAVDVKGGTAVALFRVFRLCDLVLPLARFLER